MKSLDDASGSSFPKENVLNPHNVKIREDEKISEDYDSEDASFDQLDEETPHKIKHTSTKSSSQTENVGNNRYPYGFQTREDEGEEYYFEEESLGQPVEETPKKKEKDSKKRKMVHWKSKRSTVKPRGKTSKMPIVLDEADYKELYRAYEPSYNHIQFPQTIICENWLTEGFMNVRNLLKSELEKIIDEQISAFEAIKVYRLYKTGLNLPSRLYLNHEKVYTFKEKERLRYILNHEIS